MIRLTSAVAAALLVLVSFELYTGVQRVKMQEQTLESLRVEIARETETIRTLKAEWTHLNQPERLQALAERYLPLAPTVASQIVEPASLPIRAGETYTQTSPVLTAGGSTPATGQAPPPRAKPTTGAAQ